MQRKKKKRIKAIIIVLVLGIASMAVASTTPILANIEYSFSCKNLDTHVIAPNYKSEQIISDLPIVEKHLRECNAS